MLVFADRTIQFVRPVDKDRQSGYNSANDTQKQPQWICFNYGIENPSGSCGSRQCLGLLPDRLCGGYRSSYPLCGGYADKRRLVCPISRYQRDQNIQYFLVILDERNRAFEYICDDTLLRFAYVVEHNIYGVAEVGDEARNGLGLLLHQVIELAALVGHVFDGLLHFGKADFTFCNHLRDFGAGLAQHRGKLPGKVDTSALELHYVPRVQPPLYGSGTVQPRQVLQIQAQPGSHITQPGKHVGNVFCCKSVCEKLTCPTRHALKVEWGLSGQFDHLRHQRVGLFLALQ